MATEFLDEFVGGAREATWPLIRSDLEFSYVQIGILLSVPAVVGSLLEPAIGILGEVWKRHAMVLGGGVAIALSLVLVSAAREFFVFLAALVLFYPASGAFVTLSQATLMDNDPARRGQNMARWTVVGSIGVIAGSLVLGLALLTGAGWRALFGAMAVVTLLLVLMVRHTRVGAHEPGAGESMGIVAVWQGVVAALRALRRREVLRWLLLLEFSDLLLEGFHGYLALYLVDVAGSSASTAAMGVAVWSAAVLTGGLAMVPLLGRVRGQTYLWSSAAAVLATFPMFLLVPVLGLKLVVIAMLGFASAGCTLYCRAVYTPQCPARAAP